MSSSQRLSAWLSNGMFETRQEYSMKLLEVSDIFAMAQSLVESRRTF